MLQDEMPIQTPRRTEVAERVKYVRNRNRHSSYLHDHHHYGLPTMTPLVAATPVTALFVFVIVQPQHLIIHHE